ncbi:MAG: alpha/beta fold hydrolase [Planctomycetales bacterium]|nr:alpha/beta fold hydrolase [Planctomycetales bacterium]
MKRMTLIVCIILGAALQLHGKDSAPSTDGVTDQAIPDLQRQYAEAERQAAETADRVRRQFADKDCDLPLKRRNELAEPKGFAATNCAACHATENKELERAVTLAFELRYRLQNAQLSDAETRLQAARRELTRRKEIADEIIARRVRELAGGDEKSWRGGTFQPQTARPDAAVPIGVSGPPHIPSGLPGQSRSPVETTTDNARVGNMAFPQQQFDVEMLDFQIQKAEVEVERAQIQLTKSEGEFKNGMSSNRFDVEMAEANLKAARIELEQLRRQRQRYNERHVGGSLHDEPWRNEQSASAHESAIENDMNANNQNSTNQEDADLYPCEDDNSDGSNKQSDSTATSAQPIDELKALNINGAKQWVLCRGNDRTKPVVLFVHGGPGYPLMWYSRGLDGPFLDDFVVVHWDQRGAGKSTGDSIDPDTITLDQIVDDGLAVTNRLKTKFSVKKIVLVAHSWGTMVAANMASKSPDDFSALVSVGTCADWKRADELRYAKLQEIAKERHDEEAIKKLDEIGPPPYKTAERVFQLGEMVIRLQGFSGAHRKLSEIDFIEAMQKTQEYSVEEIENTLTALSRNIDLFGNFGNEYVLMKAIPRLNLPVYFVQGEFDENTPTSLAREYFEKLDAPKGKHWKQFEGCAHMVMYEDREEFLKVLHAAIAEKP